jgi:acyl dehydratase
MRYFEDIRVGERVVLGAHTFTAAEIKSFAVRFDPQPFHLEEEAAAQSPFGALCASGWHTVAIWMRFRIELIRREDDDRRARGEPIAKLGPSPGFRELKWLKPVFAGDTVTYASEVVEARPLNSRPGWGFIGASNTGTNQHGDLVFSFLGTGFVERRP